MQIFNQSAVIPFRIKQRQLEIMLITSVNRQKWIIPKGIIEAGMAAEDTAVKEAEEEAGVRGELLDEIFGEYWQKKWGGICKIKVFALQVSEILESWPERDIRHREWFNSEEATSLIDRQDLKNILHLFTGKMSL